MRASVCSKDAFLFSHYGCERYQKASPCPALCIYRKFLEIILRILHMTKVSPRAMDEGFRDEIGLCMRDGKGFQALHMLYELISVCFTLLRLC